MQKCFHSDFNGTLGELQTESSASSSTERPFGSAAFLHAAVPDCRETDWTMSWLRVAPPVTQYSQEVRTCCIRMCRRAKKRSVVKGFFGTFRKACVCPLEDRHESARYLGQKITFEEQETAEIRNRLKAAWAAFHKYRQEHTSKTYPLCHRLRLLNMVITPTMTYASGTWTLSQTHERMIKTSQRKMLRLIVQTKRRYKTNKEKGTQREVNARNWKTK